MRWKTTLVLLLAVLGLGTFISVYEIRRPTPQQREALAKVVLDLPAETVTQLTLRLPRAEVSLARAGSQWTITPQGFRADAELIEAFLSQLAPLTAERVLGGTAERPLDPTAYGLEPPAAQVTALANGTPATLLIGGTTPLTTHRYAKLADRPEIFTVPPGVFDAINHPPETFRDPRLLRVNRWRLKTLTVSSPTTGFTLTQGDRDWTLTHPVTDRAEAAEVQTLLRQLEDLRIRRVLDDAPQVEQWATWGFDRPTAEVRLREEGASSDLTLFVGAPLAEDTALLYAKRSDEPSLYAVAKADVAALLRDPHGLRSKACFEFFASQARRVEVSWEGATQSLERAEQGWKASATGQVLAAPEVERFLSALADLRLGGFVEDAPSDLSRYGLEPPAGSVAVWLEGEEQPQRLMVGGPLEGSTNRYGRIEHRHTVVRLPEEATTLLRNAPAPSAASAPSN